jgi:hypothetical protein
MRSRLFAISFLLAAAAAPAAAQRAVPVPQDLVADIKFLSDSSLGGRLTGTAGADSAASYLARRFAAVGLQPSRGGWFQDFPMHASAPGSRQGQAEGARGRNVIGIYPGVDTALRSEVVIVGAHYDHLGGGNFGSLDPDSTGRVHNGADDNASGTAALVQIARHLKTMPPRRTVVFIAFAGEELGLLGSSWYVKNPVYELDKTVAMINLDMVGRLRDKRLIVYGTATATEFPALLDSLNWYQGFDLRKQGDGYGPSDQSSFYAAKLPVLHLFTDLHADYHRTTDDWDKLNFEGLARVAEFTAGIASALAGRTTPLTFVDVPQPSHMALVSPGGNGEVTPGYGAYLGTIPDMTENPGGVRLMGVRSGSPADSAGLEAGDIIIKIGDHDVPDLQAMTVALRSYKPGDSAIIVFRRDDQTVTSKATFGSRN